MELYRTHDPRPLTGYSFRAVSPVFDIAPFSVHGAPTATGARLWAQGADGSLRMEATCEVAA